MKKFIASLLIVAQLSVMGTALADDKKPSLPSIETPSGEIEVGAAISPMKKGQAAPFTGVLLSPRASASITVQLNSITELVKIEVDKAKADAAAQCEFRTSELKAIGTADKTILQTQIDARNKDIEILNGVIKKHEDTSDSTPFWAAVAGVGGLFAGVGLAVLVTAANNASAR